MVLTHVKNNKFISSSRAAQLTGYSQDYIGQLCRNSSITCNRVAGEWRVDLSGLLAYKKRFNPSFKPSENINTVSDNDFDELDTVVDGMISSTKAAKLTGYSQDYIGQLARSGSIKAKKIGRKWFIDENSLLEHKQHNDTLLASVQSKSVGVAHNADVRQNKHTNNPNKIPIVTYKRDDGTPLSDVINSEPSVTTDINKDSEEELTIPAIKTMPKVKDLRQRRNILRYKGISPNAGDINRPIKPSLSNVSYKNNTKEYPASRGVSGIVLPMIIILLSSIILLVEIFTPDMVMNTISKYIIMNKPVGGIDHTIINGILNIFTVDIQI